MLSIQEHAYEVRKIFQYLYVQSGYDKSYEIIIDWLNLASGVAKVEIVTELHDPSIVFCERTLSVERQRSNLWSRFSSELLTFNFIWGSMETYVRMICPKSEKDTTTMRLRKYLRIARSEFIKDANTDINELRSLMKKYLSTEIPRNFEEKSQSEKGIILATKIRNLFAHGSRNLPELEVLIKEGQLVSLEERLVSHSSRVILFIMQYMLINEYSHKNLTINFPIIYGLSNTLDEEQIELNLILKKLHIEVTDTK